jgi:PhzF family phenazine biosynthesis protein
MKAGLVEVKAQGDRWTLRAARPPETRPAEASRGELAAMLGISAKQVGENPLWVDTGTEQLLIPLTTVEAVRAARPQAEQLERNGRSPRAGESMAYVWAHAEGDAIEARFFFTTGGSVVEDPATGSACANLGGYLIATGAKLPAHAVIDQGAQVGRPSRLELAVDEQKQIFVTGEVVELGGGTLVL